MNIEILRPESLWLLALLPLLWWWHRRTIAPLRGFRRTAAFSVRALVTCAIILALAEPRWISATDRQEVLLLIDQSRSVDNAALDAAEKFAADADFGGADIAWMGFGGGGRIFRNLEDLKKSDPGRIDPLRTRIDTALALAAASFRQGRVKTIVLFSDGNSTGAPDAAAALAAQDVRVHAVPT
ncbi:MAG TPA: hypothetical protein PLS03_14035, partial [Terrimicrobiaceae bacterium]|nr:hypothetical protein [Terrimicrobiaceae bacterium]